MWQTQPRHDFGTGQGPAVPGSTPVPAPAPTRRRTTTPKMSLSWHSYREWVELAKGTRYPTLTHSPFAHQVRHPSVRLRFNKDLHPASLPGTQHATQATPHHTGLVPRAPPVPLLPPAARRPPAAAPCRPSLSSRPCAGCPAGWVGTCSPASCACGRPRRGRPPPSPEGGGRGRGGRRHGEKG